jgi:hypothetical protein
MKKNENSSHKLPKQQSTNFWSQEILGVNQMADNSTQECSALQHCEIMPHALTYVLRLSPTSRTS